MILSDKEIFELAQQGMITPFVGSSVREANSAEAYIYPEKVAPQAKEKVSTNKKVISYGLSSYGYDIRLSPKEFKIFRHIPGTVINPKQFNPDNLESVQCQEDKDGKFFIIPGHSYGLGVAIEQLHLPPNVTAICLGKSTYARTALIANVTPAEAGWKGHLTLEFSNSCPADMRVYANEGIVQLLFFRGETCQTPYNARSGGGKYQGQNESITEAKV